MVIFHLTAVLTDRPNPAGDRLVACRDQPAIAKGSEIFRWKERKAANRSDTPDRFILIGGTDRLSSIFNDGNTSPWRQSP